MGFIEQVRQRASHDPRTIAIPECTNEAMLSAALRANREGIARIVLVGHPEEVSQVARDLGEDVAGVRIVDVDDETHKSSLLAAYEASAHKVVPARFIEKRLSDPLYLALLMEAVGEADGVLAGVDATTYEFLIAAQTVIGLAEGFTTASALILLEVEGFEGAQGNIIGMSDGAVCVEPTVEQHAGIAISSCETFRAVTGTEARCAFLSYSTDGSGGMSAPVVKVREAVELARTLRPDLKIDGEFQSDAALVARVGAKKVKRDSEVAGQANVLVFPDAAACNIASKLVQILAPSQVYGPMYQGFRLPVLDCSRSDTAEILYNDMALLGAMALDAAAARQGDE